MKIRLVSHASIIIDTGDTQIWSDPWLDGRAFNDSWALLPPAHFDTSWLDEINYIWISHEHPDNFHIPTLASLPENFKRTCTILFQRNNSDKMFEALQKLGYQNCRALPHRTEVHLSSETKIYCYQVGQMDSCLAIRCNNEMILNINDAELNNKDCRIIARDVGTPNIILNQFSIAGYSGLPDREKYLRNNASNILQNMINNHKQLGAHVTIPFASLIYFCCEDNRYINKYANKPGTVAGHFEEHELKLAVLFPGDHISVQEALDHDSSEALTRYARYFDSMNDLPYRCSETIPVESIKSAFVAFAEHIHQKYPKIILKILKPVVVYFEDIGCYVSFSIYRKSFEERSEAAKPDLILGSQPFLFALRYPFGFQTLGVSARYSMHGDYRNWRFHRILASLNNAEIYLKPRYLLTWRNLCFFLERLRGGWNQLRYQIERQKS